MADVVIYTSTVCPYCVRAKMLFGKKKVAFREINLDREPDLRDEMVKMAGGRRTVPQIFIGDRYIGGCDELYELEWDGELDPLLAS